MSPHALPYRLVETLKNYRMSWELGIWNNTCQPVECRYANFQVHLWSLLNCRSGYGICENMSPLRSELAVKMTTSNNCIANGIAARPVAGALTAGKALRNTSDYTIRAPISTL